MHSDGATEPLVKLALKHKKPFAVVPCCVFPKAPSNPARCPRVTWGKRPFAPSHARHTMLMLRAY